MAPPLRLGDLETDVLRILLRALPVDARGRACCVCRRLRDVLQDAALWQELDLSAEGGVARKRPTLALLLGAAARARGGLVSLNLQRLAPELLGDAVFELIAGAPALRTLTLPDRVFQTDVARAAAAAPQLQLLRVDTLEVNGAGALRVLRNELAVLRVRRLCICHYYDPADGDVREPEVPFTWQAVLDALGDAGVHPSLTGLDLHRCRWDATTLARLEDITCARRLRVLSLQVEFQFVPEVARMLRGYPSLRSLCLSRMEQNVYDYQALREADAAELAAALAAAPALTGFALCSFNLFRNAAAGAALLAGLTAHPSLRALVLNGNALPHPRLGLRLEEHAGTPQPRAVALGALVDLLSAEAPALRCVSLASCWVDEDAMIALLAALARRPTRLRLLDLRENTRRLAQALQAAAPPNAARVEVSLDEALERAHLEQGLQSLDTGTILMPALDFPPGGLDAIRMHEAVTALDGALAAADAAPDA